MAVKSPGPVSPSVCDFVYDRTIGRSKRKPVHDNDDGAPPNPCSRVNETAKRLVQHVKTPTQPDHEEQYESYPPFDVNAQDGAERLDSQTPEEVAKCEATLRAILERVPKTANNYQAKCAIAKFSSFATIQMLLALSPFTEREKEAIIQDLYLLFRDDTLTGDEEEVRQRDEVQAYFYKQIQSILGNESSAKLSDSERIQLEDVVWKYFSHLMGSDRVETRLSWVQTLKIHTLYHISFFYVLDTFESIGWKVLDWSRSFTSGDQNQQFRRLIETLLQHLYAFFTKTIEERNKTAEINENGGVREHMSQFFRGLAPNGKNPNNLYTTPNGSVTESTIHQLFCRKLIRELPKYSLAKQANRICRYHWSKLPHFNPDIQKIADSIFNGLCYLIYFPLYLFDEIVRLTLFRFGAERVLTNLATKFLEDTRTRIAHGDDFRSSLDRVIINLCEKLQQMLETEVVLQKSHISIVNTQIVRDFVTKFLEFVEKGILENGQVREPGRVSESFSRLIPQITTKGLLADQLSVALGLFFSSFNSEDAVEKNIRTCLENALRIFHNTRERVPQVEQRNLRQRRKASVDRLLTDIVQRAVEKNVTGETPEVVAERLNTVLVFFTAPIKSRLDQIDLILRFYHKQIHRQNPQAETTRGHLHQKLQSLHGHIERLERILHDVKDIPTDLNDSINAMLTQANEIIQEAEARSNHDPNGIYTIQDRLFLAQESSSRWTAFAQKFAIAEDKNFVDDLTPGFFEEIDFEGLQRYYLHEQDQAHLLDGETDIQRRVVELRGLKDLHERRVQFLTHFDIERYISHAESLREGPDKKTFWDSLRRQVKEMRGAVHDAIGRLKGERSDPDQAILELNSLRSEEMQEIERLTEVLRTCKPDALDDAREAVRNAITRIQQRYRDGLEAETLTPVKVIRRRIHQSVIKYTEWLDNTCIPRDRRELLYFTEQTRDLLNRIIHSMNAIVPFVNYDTPSRVGQVVRAVSVAGLGAIAFLTGYFIVPTALAVGALPGLYSRGYKPAVESRIVSEYRKNIRTYVNQIIHLSSEELFPAGIANTLMHFSNQHILRA